jgi:hypothetical protein
VTGLQARFEFGDSLQGFFSQCAPFTSDFGLSNALDVWHAAVERGDELVQMPQLERSIRFSNPVASGHHNSPGLLRDHRAIRRSARRPTFTISGEVWHPARTGDEGDVPSRKSRALAHATDCPREEAQDVQADRDDEARFGDWYSRGVG